MEPYRLGAYRKEGRVVGGLVGGGRVKKGIPKLLSSTV